MLVSPKQMVELLNRERASASRLEERAEESMLRLRNKSDEQERAEAVRQERPKHGQFMQAMNKQRLDDVRHAASLARNQRSLSRR